MAFQSEIELRVKVIDKELRDLEKRAEKIQNTNPFSASGARSGQTAQQNRVAQAALRTDQKRLQLQQEINVGRIRELNDTAKLNRLFKDAAVVRASYAKDAERAAAATAKEAAAAQKVAAANRKKNISNVGAGIGFPLLFGSGPLSVLGGAAGSAGGFGTQILASAIGGILDQAIADVAKLGQAFTKTGLDAAALSKAIGDIGGSTKKLIEETKEVAGSQAAAEAAAKLMSATIGEDAVTALTDLGDATNELGSATAILNTEFQALAAQLLGPVAAGVAGLLERTNLINAADRITAGGGEDAQRLRAAAERGAKNSDDPIQGAIDERLAETAKIIAERRTEATQAITDANIESSKALEILENEEKILNINGNLLNDAVFELEKGNIKLRTKGALQKDNLTDLEKELIKQREINDLKNLDNKRAEQQAAANRKAETAARQAFRAQERAAKEALRLQTTLNQEAIKAIGISVKYAAAFEGTEASLDRQLLLLNREKQLKAQIIRDNTDNQQIENLKLDNLDNEYRILKQNLETRKQQLAVERTLAELQAATSLASTERGLQQELSGLQLGQSDAYALQQKQADRYVNTLSEINAQIAEQYVLIESTPTPDKKTIEQATLRLAQLQEESTLYKTILPQIAAAEQAQLRYNQAFAAINPAVNSLVSGLQEVVAGTKTAEEAFADFLRTIADQLVQTAATMIAQYIALSIARRFAFGANGPTFNGASAGDITNAGANMASGLIPRADGGPVTSSQAYIVGEEGPELFIPGVSGSISNNDQFEAARNAMSGRSEGSSDAFNENADAIAVSNSYTRERTLERESQTREGSASSMVIETQVINNVEYATVEQVQIASAASAKQARAQVFSDMKNKPTIRRQVGVR